MIIKDDNERKLSDYRETIISGNKQHTEETVH